MISDTLLGNVISSKQICVCKHKKTTDYTLILVIGLLIRLGNDASCTHNVSFLFATFGELSAALGISANETTKFGKTYNIPNT